VKKSPLGGGESACRAEQRCTSRTYAITKTPKCKQRHRAKTNSGRERSSEEAHLGIQDAVAPVEEGLAGVGRLLIIGHDLEAKNEGPNETEDKAELTIVHV